MYFSCYLKTVLTLNLLIHLVSFQTFVQQDKMAQAGPEEKKSLETCGAKLQKSGIPN